MLTWIGDTFRGGWAATVVAICLFCSVAPTSAQLAAPLSSAERVRLEAGETVVRPENQRRGGMRLMGGASFQVINLPEDAIWRALSDPAAYRYMLPQVESSRQVAQQGATRVVHIHHRRGVISVDYYIRMTYQQREKLVLFRLDETRPHDIRAGWGYIRVHPWSEGRTLVSFGVLVDIGSGVIAGLMRPTFQEWLLKIPLTMKWYVEGRGRSRYAREAHPQS
ncbi:MAG: hypothetical protein GXP55_24725 [Deltaproteobacteria bacterium]|nr:hypothetical protein [Deltaproteobacteria bacterium]